MAPAPPAEPAPPPVPQFATIEHLYLALIYADHLNDKDKAKAHARRWIEQGGKNLNLDAWVQNLLNDK